MNKDNIKNKLEKIKSINLSEEIKYQESGIVSKQLLKEENGNITLFAFYKGESLTEHTSSFAAAVLVIEGKMEFTIGGKIFVVEGGGYIDLPAGVPHALSAIDKSKMLLIMIK